ncbi:MAG: glucose 1-dehydrogenase [Alphaproteobacteria bacterium]|nr:glucose 1-dehydrogenase [Alphaproteobacteria bacterium]MBU1516375.1 glucose 1-dehydrogenase [Alphaproteobacteria bacterium]MBU2093388.1 glucose 1-dehydrogenase [Alphaproteobacteria bacterium]MBU2153875.1 glucose 1-dehydrogenase [Alphaproteobacteria bacterium]MBU2307747.1 glucose 1-dehydrogenase [Alphaproteobacteria bacterium]
MRAFDGKVVLVTGAAGDIGAAAAAAFARDGADVVVTDRRGDALEAVADALREAGGGVLAHACDQSDPTAVDGLFAAIRNRFGRLDAAFLNAGYGRYGPLIDMPFDQWRKHVDVNLNGGFLMAQGAARAMRDAGRGGAILFTASTAATHICDLLGAYASSKAGVRMLAKSLASELGVWRIRVNLVLPGVIETAMTKSLIDDPAVRADAISNTPVGRLGKPEDIARLAVFLCGDQAGYVTGAEVLADGGQTLHGYPRWFSADYAKAGAAWAPHTQPHAV